MIRKQNNTPSESSETSQDRRSIRPSGCWVRFQLEGIEPGTWASEQSKRSRAFGTYSCELCCPFVVFFRRERFAFACGAQNSLRRWWPARRSIDLKITTVDSATALHVCESRRRASVVSV